MAIDVFQARGLRQPLKPEAVKDQIVSLWRRESLGEACEIALWFINQVNRNDEQSEDELVVIPQVLDLFGLIRLNQGRFHEAENAFTEMRRLAGYSGETCEKTIALLRSTNVKLRQGRIGEAEWRFSHHRAPDAENCTVKCGYCGMLRLFTEASILGRTDANKKALEILEKLVALPKIKEKSPKWSFQMELLEGIIYLELGRRRMSFGQISEGKQYVKKAYEFARQMRLPFLHGWSALAMAQAFIPEDNASIARDYLREAESVFNRLRSDWGIASCDETRGEIFSRSHAHRYETFAFYRQSLAYCEKNGLLKQAGQIHSKIGHLELKSGNYQEAIRHYEADAASCKELGQGTLMAFSHRHIARAQRMNGDLKRAHQEAHDSLALFLENTDNRYQHALAHQELAHVLIDMGRTAEAESKLMKSERLFGSFEENDDYTKASIHHLRARLLVLQGKEAADEERYPLWLEAEEEFRNSLALRTRLDSRSAETYLEYGLLQHEMQNIPEAQTYFAYALRKAISLGDDGLLRRFQRLIKFADSGYAEFIERVFTGAYFNIEEVVLAFMEPGRLRDYEPRRRTASVMFADIRSFVSLTNGMPESEVIELVNGFMDRVVSAIEQNRGKVDKFIGDAVMAVFGVDSSSPDCGLSAAINSALDAQALVNDFNAARVLTDAKPIYVKFSINMGDMLWGIFGTRQRRDFTAIGEMVNIASRIGSIEIPGEDHKEQHQILVGVTKPEAMIVINEFSSVNLGEHLIRGVQDPVRVYMILGRGGNEQEQQERGHLSEFPIRKTLQMSIEQTKLLDTTAEAGA
jgi:class 3 adenylate cyclase/predicted negative regulator of RcsB-dependent stress response